MSQKTFTLFILLSSISFHSFAGLGDSPTPIQQNQTTGKAKSMNKISFVRYSVQDLGGSGTRIREYVSQRGVVFAIAWEGRAHPDIDSLLSSYANQFHALEKNQPKTKGMRNQRILQSSNLIVERGGHFGHLKGRAYDPTLIPEGVSIEEIQ